MIADIDDDIVEGRIHLIWTRGCRFLVLLAGGRRFDDLAFFDGSFYHARCALCSSSSSISSASACTLAVAAAAASHLLLETVRHSSAAPSFCSLHEEKMDRVRQQTKAEECAVFTSETDGGGA